MSSYDEWKIRYKVDTSELDKALEKVKSLHNVAQGSYGSGRGGSARSKNTSDYMVGWKSGDLHKMSRSMEILQRQKMKSFNDSIKAVNHAERLREQHHKRELQRLKEQDRAQKALSKSSAAGVRSAVSGLTSSGYDKSLSDYYRNLERDSNRSSRQAGVQSRRDLRLGNQKLASSYGINALEAKTRDAGIYNNYSAKFKQHKDSILSASSPEALSAARIEMRKFSSEVESALKHQRNLTAEQNKMSFATQSMSSSMANFARSYLSVFAAVDAASSVYSRAKEMENLSVTTLMAAGSAEKAAVAFEKIKATAKETGLSLPNMVDMYNKVVISAKDAKLGDKETEAIFRGITTLQVGYGFNTEQQKLVSKAFSQMLSKNKVTAEDFKGQLGEQAPGIMGTMVEAGGYKDTGALEDAMKKGKVDLPILIKFIDLLEKKAKDSGAYQKGTNTMTAAENRMSASYSLFAKSFMAFFDSQLKDTFNSTAATLDKLTKWLDISKAEQDKTGIVGGFTVRIDTVGAALGQFGDTVILAAEGLNQLAKLFGMGSNSPILSAKQSLARREMDEAYFASKGITSPMEKFHHPRSDYKEFSLNRLKSLGASQEEAERVYGRTFEQSIGRPSGQFSVLNNLLPGTLTAPLAIARGLSSTGVRNSAMNIPSMYGMPGQFVQPKVPQQITISPTINLQGVDSHPSAIQAAIVNAMKEILPSSY